MIRIALAALALTFVTLPATAAHAAGDKACKGVQAIPIPSDARIVEIDGDGWYIVGPDFIERAITECEAWKSSQSPPDAMEIIGGSKRTDALSFSPSTPAIDSELGEDAL